ncbi:MAG: anaerobic ribonucleoside-triphosphate reductase activating protein [Lachnospiraceae bacterium]|nr:anaerobic ribonucleoside-triphosphate reductase activating protein [Lachnospiraceae bacterium]
MIICGLNKTTLLDYPGLVAATVFLGGCNFRCPFCHNKELVLNPSSCQTHTEEEVLSHLQKRKGILQGVCITGGEPTLQKDLPDFIRSCKELGYKVKLDTNGTNPGMMKSLYREGLIDYVAMDIKSCPGEYPLVAGLTESAWRQKDAKSPDAGPDLSERIKESVSFLIRETGGDFDYEFRTTVVKELHTRASFEKIAEWIKGANHYYLQSYEESEGVICPGFSAYEPEQMEEFADLVKGSVKDVSLRGIG